MNLLVLGLTGLRSSGKDTVAQYLSKKYGFKTFVFTDHVLAPILRQRGMPITRENLVNLAMEMRAKDGTDILAKILSEKIHSGFFVISGIRFIQEVDYFRKRFGKNFRLVRVECEPEKRHERAVKRGEKGEHGLSYDHFIAKESLPTEKVIPETMAKADYFIENSGPMQDLYPKIDELIKRIKAEAH
jgi:dephospho-CoA kinase